MKITSVIVKKEKKVRINPTSREVIHTLLHMVMVPEL
jgi:hypothetical protein